MTGRLTAALTVGVLAMAEAGWAHPANDRGSAVLRVLVLNQAGGPVKPELLDRAEADAASIFSAAGVRLAWRHGHTEGADFDVVVKIVSGTRLAGLSSAESDVTLGFALTANERPGLRGQIVCVRLDEIERYAGDHTVSVPHLCGLVIAHEIGHLLLSAGHSPSGLMRAAWNPESLGAMYFTRSQVKTIQARLAAAAR